MDLTFYICTSLTPYQWFSVLCCRRNALQWITFGLYYYLSWEMRINFIQLNLHYCTYKAAELIRVNYCCKIMCPTFTGVLPFFYLFYLCKELIWPVPVTACLLRTWVRIPPRAWMFVCCEFCVLSGRGLCDGLIIRSEESYWLWCVVVCDHETSQARRLKPARGL